MRAHLLSSRVIRRYRVNQQSSFPVIRSYRDRHQPYRVLPNHWQKRRRRLLRTRHRQRPLPRHSRYRRRYPLRRRHYLFHRRHSQSRHPRFRFHRSSCRFITCTTATVSGPGGSSASSTRCAGGTCRSGSTAPVATTAIPAAAAAVTAAATSVATAVGHKSKSRGC